MPLDDRLRRELHRDAARIDPDIDAQLRAVQARVRRPAFAISPLLVGAALVIALIVVLREPLSAPIGPAATLAPSGPSAAIAGTFSTVLAAADPGVAEHGLAGTWELRIGSDGVAVLTPPAGFQAGATSFPGIAISIVGDRLRTDALYTDYCSSIGTYRWERTSDRLTFEPVGDPCSIRTVLLATAPWTEAP